MTEQPLLSAAFAVCSAFLFALSSQIQNVGLERADPRSGAIVSITTAALGFWILSPFVVESWYWFTTSAIIFALVGVFRPALSATMALTGIKYMGPTLTNGLTASSPIFGAAFAVSLLGETLTTRIVLGTLAVVAGCVVATLKPKAMPRSWPLWALIFPLGAALIRAAAHTFTKFGLATLPSPFFAGLVSNSVSAVMAFSSFKLQGLRFASGGFGTYKWFVLSGLINGTSQYTLNKALQLGSVVTVVPIVSSTPLFSILLALFVFRRESITWRTVATIGLIVPGVILVALR